MIDIILNCGNCDKSYSIKNATSVHKLSPGWVRDGQEVYCGPCADILGEWVIKDGFTDYDHHPPKRWRKKGRVVVNDCPKCGSAYRWGNFYYCDTFNPPDGDFIQSQECKSREAEKGKPDEQET